MQPHIARTIEDIDLKIGFLQRLKSALENFDSPVSLANPPIVTVTSNGNGAEAKPRQAKTPIAHTPPRKVMGRPRKQAVGERSADQDEVQTVPAAFRAVLPEFDGEFSSRDIAHKATQRFPRLAAKISIATAVTLNSLSAAGEIERIGKNGRFGVYRRVRSTGADLQKLHREIHEEIDAAKPKND